jgi:penicillin-binding protein 2
MADSMLVDTNNAQGSPLRERRDQEGYSRRAALWTFLRALCALCVPSRLESVSAPSLAGALEQALAQGFGKRTGAGVVVEIVEGKILAAHNLPAARQRLALPGSTLKTFTLYSLLKSGKLNPDERFLCPYNLEIAGHRLDCPHAPNLGPISPADALAYSCNNFFAQMALRLAPEELARALEEWGFASATHLAANETAGKIETAHSTSELQLQSIGESGIHVTPLELLQAFRRLAFRRRERAAQDEPLASVFAGLEAGVANGIASVARTDGLDAAGKTGTSLSDEGHWTHGWFAGYAPAQAPEIVQVVFLERGNGPVDAAGIAHNVFTAYRDRRAGR